MSSQAATLTVSWDDLHRDTRALARRLIPIGPFSGIIAVARGGLVPAAILSRELGLRLVDTLCISSYEGRAHGRPQVLKPVAGDGAGWLVVDDLVDSGDTAHAVKRMLPRCHYATVYAKPAGRPLVDTHVVDVEQNVWIVFPWGD